MSDSSHSKEGGDLIEVTVKSQLGKFDGLFAETDAVQAVITAAVASLSIDPTDRIELVLTSDRKVPLDPGTVLETLLKKPDHKKPKLDFILTATGNGV